MNSLGLDLRLAHRVRNGFQRIIHPAMVCIFLTPYTMDGVNLAFRLVMMMTDELSKIAHKVVLKSCS